MIIKIGKFMLAGFVLLVVYACTADQLSRSGLEGYDTRPPAAERKDGDGPIFRAETRQAILDVIEMSKQVQEEAEAERQRSD